MSGDTWTIERWFEGQTVVIFGTGHSLAKRPDFEAPVDQSEIDWLAPKLWQHYTKDAALTVARNALTWSAYVRGKAPVILINQSWMLARRWGDVLYACDAEWWKDHEGAREFLGLKLVLKTAKQSFAEINCRPWFPQITPILSLGRDGVSLDPKGIKHGRSAICQALNIALLMAGARALLVGFDFYDLKSGRSHWFGHHRKPSRPDRYEKDFRGSIEKMAPKLRDAGLEVVNCTPGSQLRCFPMARLEDVL